MDPYIIRQRVDLARPGGLEHWPDMMMIEYDANAHCWEVTVVNEGVPVDLTGCKAIGWFTRKDEQVVPVDGEIAGNVISVTLDKACYAVHGDLYALLKVYTTDTTITLARVRYYVARGVSDNIYDATGALPSVQELLTLLETLKAYDAVKLDANLGAHHAGKLLYVSADGSVRPLALGSGLKIVNGVLTVTGQTEQPNQPDEAILFVDQGDGVVLIDGAAFVDQGDGIVLLDGVTATDQGNGVVLMA